MWALYILMGFVLVLIYFAIRIEWVYHHCERLLRTEGRQTYRNHYPTWDRMLIRYFYIWRFKSLKGKK